jgi:hypothetical protein
MENRVIKSHGTLGVLGSVISRRPSLASKPLPTMNNALPLALVQRQKSRLVNTLPWQSMKTKRCREPFPLRAGDKLSAFLRWSPEPTKTPRLHARTARSLANGQHYHVRSDKRSRIVTGILSALACHRLPTSVLVRSMLVP